MASDIVIAVDTREPAHGSWEDHFTVPTVRKCLDTGDYSVLGCEELISVERKTVDDLIGCFCGSRERFVKELKRFQAIPDRWIICEGNYSDLLNGCYRSEMKPQAAWESAIALMTRFRIALLMAGRPAVAAALCQSLLMRWAKEHQRVLDTIEKAGRELRKTA